jgi:leader peptidase (prepilin peptidase)/N-methyltransferase
MLWSRLPAILVALGFAAVSAAVLPWPVWPFAAALGVLSVLIAVIDLEQLIIPDTANALILVLGIGLAAVERTGTDWQALAVDLVSRAVVSGGLLWFIRSGYQAMRGSEGLGLGDVKLAFAAGPWLAWSTMPYVLELAAVGALVGVVVVAIRRRRRPERNTPLPFGAFLAPAVWAGFVAERAGLLTVVAF